MRAGSVKPGSLAESPSGSVKVNSGGSPASPGMRQYVCQPFSWVKRTARRFSACGVSAFFSETISTSTCGALFAPGRPASIALSQLPSAASAAGAGARSASGEPIAQSIAREAPAEAVARMRRCVNDAWEDMRESRGRSWSRKERAGARTLPKNSERRVREAAGAPDGGRTVRPAGILAERAARRAPLAPDGVTSPLRRRPRGRRRPSSRSPRRCGRSRRSPPRTSRARSSSRARACRGRTR